MCILGIAGVSGDMCADFCIRQLGPAGCPKGSWCKNNHDCHSLFWTSDERTNICVFTGSSDCLDVRPVLCSEATASTSITTRSPVSMRSSRPVSPATPRRFEFITRTDLFSDRPHLKLTLVRNGQNRGFPVMFDTGSSALILGIGDNSLRSSHRNESAYTDIHPQDPVERPVNENEFFCSLESAVHMMVERPHVQPVFFGTDANVWAILTIGSVFDTARIFAGTTIFDFEAETVLGHRESFYVDYILGASKISQFALSAQIFAYIGDSAMWNVFHIPYTSRHRAGVLSIGSSAIEDAERACGGLRMIPRSPSHQNLLWFQSPSIVDWTVSGGVQLGDGPIQRFQMSIDTGASSISFPVTRAMETEITNLLTSEEFGARPSPLLWRSGFTNCSASTVGRLPPIHYYFWNQTSSAESFNITVPPRLYATVLGNGTCRLSIQDSVTRNETELLLGPKILTDMSVVFDLGNNRIGLC